MKLLAALLIVSLPALADDCISKSFGRGVEVIQCGDTVTISTDQGVSVCSKQINGHMDCTPVKFEK